MTRLKIISGQYHENPSFLSLFPPSKMLFYASKTNILKKMARENIYFKILSSFIIIIIKKKQRAKQVLWNVANAL